MHSLILARVVTLAVLCFSSMAMAQNFPPDVAEFQIGGVDGPDAVLQAIPGDALTIVLYCRADEPVEGYQFSIVHDCDLTPVPDSESIDDGVFSNIVAEFWSFSAGNCEVVIGILLDSLPPFSGQTVPPTPVPIEIVRFDVEVAATIGSGDILTLALVDGAQGGGTVSINNVVVIDNQSVSPILDNDAIETIEVFPTFTRGDCNEDGLWDIADPIRLIGYLFQGQMQPGCLAACDFNGDGQFDISDPITAVNYFFVLPVPLPAPFPNCGMPDQAENCANPESCP